jgi:alpha-L-arabinofuranosidase
LPKSIEEAAEFGAAMVAYCNAELDADLPPEMMRWPRLRAENGHPDPYAVTYWQLGNEAFFFIEANQGEVQYLSHHFYEPWGIREVRENNEPVDPLTLTHDQVWYCWVSTFGMDPDTGFNSEFEGAYKDAALKYGVDLAITEWNWNGWCLKTKSPIWMSSRLSQNPTILCLYMLLTVTWK